VEAEAVSNGGADRGVDPTKGVNEDKFCRSCGEQLRDDARFCRRCGTARAETPEEPSRAAGAPTEASTPPDRPAAAGHGAEAQPPGAPAGHPSSPPPAAPPPPAYIAAAPYSPPPGYSAPTSGYPTQYQYPQPPAEPAGSRSNGWLIGGGVAAALAIAGIAVGLYVAASGGSDTQTRLVATPVLTAASSVASTQAPAPASHSTHTRSASSAQAGARGTPIVHQTTTPTVARTSISSAIERRKAADTIERHFSLISQHQFSAAYALLAPSLQTGESSWVAAHGEDGIYKVDVIVDAELHSATSATATVAKMTTLDAHGCKNWSGSWELTKIDGEWRISKANVDPVPC
jgi:hypothetical protein